MPYVRKKQYLELMALLKGIEETQGHMFKRMEKMMSAVSEFGVAMNAFFDEQSASINELKASIDGLSGDVAWMKARIDELQNNSGPISPTDQDILNALQERAKTAVARGKEAVAQAKALDDATPPVVPPELAT